MLKPFPFNELVMHEAHNRQGLTDMKPNESMEIIWTAEGIGRAIGRSAAFVRRKLAAMPASPVHRFGGRYWAFRDELLDYFEREGSKKAS